MTGQFIQNTRMTWKTAIVAAACRKPHVVRRLYIVTPFPALCSGYCCARDAPPVIPTTPQHGYKQMKAKIGQSRVRPWKWMPFTNPARKVHCFFSVLDSDCCCWWFWHTGQ